MSEDPGGGARSEDDFVDLWLANRSAAGSADGASRARTRPPSWAPQVATPTAPPVAAPAVPAEPAAALMPESAPRSAPRFTPEPTPEPAREPEAPVVARVEADPAPTQDLPVQDLPREDLPVEQPVVVVEAPVEPVVVPDDAPIRMTFAPRTKARQAVAVGTLLAATAAVIGTYVAAREKDLPSIGIAATLWVLTAIIWAVHSGTSVTRLSVRGGQLQVLQHGVRTTIDLTSSYTPVEVHGRPGRHGWKVVFLRRDMSPFVIDHSMVDPKEFMRVLRYYRPGVDAEAV